MYAPTKKTLYILIACILFLSLISFAKIQTEKNKAPLALETSSGDSSQENSQNLEELFGDNNTETGGGTLVASTEENLTESFSKSFFAKYYTINDGGEISDTDGQALVDEATNAFKTLNLGNVTHYSFQDLKIVKSNEQNLRNFANTYVTKENTCLTNIQKVAKETQDPIQTGTLYKKCAETLIQIPITQEINEEYLNLINTYYLIGEKTYSLEGAKSDPLKALLLMKEIGNLDDQKNISYQKISSLIQKSGIIFSNDEPGRAWVGSVQ